MSDISEAKHFAHEAVEDGYVLFVKEACETCAMLRPVYQQLLSAGFNLKVFVQDDPAFYEGLAPIDDTRLESSFRYDVETVPTLIKVEGGREVGREFGWQRDAWQALTGQPDLGGSLPAWQPGCGSKSREPGVYEHLVEAFGDPGLQARRIEVDHWDDPVERCYDRGWSDGLPVVPPTDARILRMLSGTSRRPDEIVGLVPPNLAPCSVEKVAINAVLAGCKPEYMPVLLAALETALEPVFTMHGLLCTTCFSGPIVVVNGPIAKRIGMNWGINALGQGNRANATIGRALQLIIRNVGGGIPGELDRSTLGGPGKYTFCFAEDETDPSWEPLSVARGIAPGKSAVTLFQGDGIQGFIDQRSRTPEELTRSFASALVAVGHPKLAQFTNAMLVLSAEHYEIYRKAGWDRQRITAELHAACVRPAEDLVQGAHGIGEGIHPSRKDEGGVPKFWDDGLLIVRAGGQAGLFSAILCGWTGGRFRDESQPVTREIKE
ncbi:thioredoxin [Pigmentiphaga sp. H8]|uniref:thioredoxin family protein n=1 Tax=unclassified Pigmentiphaga TaxID=2626614 RepID=UPI000F59DB3B|nr:thioredoxin family protein [Pigmentiphaga sp. H8]AZG10732.1 thioredoxin [Pigmentiphaga sp. H8]